MAIVYEPIGTIHTLFKDIEGTPIQPVGAQGVRGTVVIEPAYCAGLKDLEGFSHIILVYHFDRSQGYSLVIKPFMDDTPRGLFATRAPRRPNPIGLSVVRLERVENCTLHVGGVDMVDGTPLLDIKPYVPQFDAPEVHSIGCPDPSGSRRPSPPSGLAYAHNLVPVGSLTGSFRGSMPGPAHPVGQSL